MKSFTYFLCLLLCSITNLCFAQCVNEVSTNPLSPTNDALPVDALNPNGDARYLNQFDFYPLTPGGSLEDYDLTNMYFAGVPLLEMDNIWSDQVIPYYNYINKQPIPISKNGWELLLLNVGRYPNDVTPNSSNESFQSIPYIVIYNRYSGLLRVFANFGLDAVIGNGPDAVEIKLQYLSTTAVSGNLRLNEGNDRALDIQSKVTTAKAIAKATNTQRQWFSADFQIAYDPCVCYYPSEIQIYFNQISSENITLYGRGITVTDDLINPSLQVNPKDFLTSFDNSYTVPQGGILAYKGVLPLINDYEARLAKYKQDLYNIGKHNEIVDQNLGAIKMLKYMLTLVVTQGIGAGEISATGAVEAESWYADIMDQYGGFITKAGKFDEIKVLEIVKTIFGGETKTYIEQNFERMPDPDVPSKPQSITYNEMRFTGTITDFEQKAGPKFFTPGTYGSEGTESPVLSTMYNYPIYNEALGVIAIIETPKVLISTSQYAEGTNREYETTYLTNDELYSVKYQSFTYVTQMMLLNEIKYTLNPALDIKSVNVKAAWNIKAKEKVKNTNGLSWNSYIDPNYTTNLYSKKMNVSVYDPVYRYFSESYMEGTIDDGWQYNLDFATDTNFRRFDLATKYFNLQEFHPMKIGVGLKNEYVMGQEGQFFYPRNSYGIGIEFEAIELKLIVDVEYYTIGSDGKSNTVTQFLTIPVEIEDWGHTSDYNQQTHEYVYQQYLDAPGFQLDNDLHTTWDTGVIPEYLQIGPSNFDGSSVEGFYLGASNNYICTALNEIVINGDFVIDPAYSVEVIAGNYINVINNSQIPSEAVLHIGSFLPSTSENYEVSGNYVKRFCKGELQDGPSYNANSAESKNGILPFTSDNNSVNINNEDKRIEMVNIYPNPSTGNFNIHFNKEVTELVIVIYDLYGKEVNYSILNNRPNDIELDLQNANSGVYTLQISTQNRNFTKKIIVN